MISAYHRPQSLAEALSLLARPNTLPLGGGTKLNGPAYKNLNFEVVDIQALGLNLIHKKGSTLEIGAAAPLETLRQNPHIFPALKEALRLEAPLNLRNAATAAGTLAACDGRSPFATLLLALDAKLTLVSEQNSSSLGLAEYWALRPAGLITRITLPLNLRCAYEQVARSPADLPIVCAALAQWSGGRSRLALGGWGKIPALALDGTEADGLAEAARNACHESADAWGSAEYRMDVAATLAQRCLSGVQP
ncbi:MAG: xanthine dehydrogenase family protein subunit M [Anaerolineales bacterium]